jgi:hypothetical protein
MRNRRTRKGTPRNREKSHQIFEARRAAEIATALMCDETAVWLLAAR